MEAAAEAGEPDTQGAGPVWDAHAAGQWPLQDLSGMPTQ